MPKIRLAETTPGVSSKFSVSEIDKISIYVEALSDYSFSLLGTFANEAADIIGSGYDTNTLQKDIDVSDYNSLIASGLTFSGLDMPVLHFKFHPEF